MLAWVFLLWLHHIEHSRNPLGDLSSPRDFGRTLHITDRQKKVIGAFFSLHILPHPGPSRIPLTSVRIFVLTPLLGRDSFHWSVIDIDSKRLLKSKFIRSVDLFVEHHAQEKEQAPNNSVSC